MTAALVVKYKAAPQGGREAVVTPAGVKLAKEMAAQGHPLYGIAAALGLDPKTLRACKKRQADLDNALVAGHAALEHELVDLLLQAGRGGAWACCMFLLKARCGYRETGPTDGGPDHRTTVNVLIPPPLTDAQAQALLSGLPKKERESLAAPEPKTIDETGKVIRG